MKLGWNGFWFVCLLVSARCPAMSAADLQGLASDDSDQKIATIDQLARSGDARAQVVLQALLDGNLLVSPEATLLIADGDKLVDAASGGAAPGSADQFEKVRVNNRIRTQLDGALAGFGLLAADPATRISAVQALMKAPDPAHAAMLKLALSRESDPAIRVLLLRADSLVKLLDPAVDQRLAAVKLLADSGDPAVLTQLRNRLSGPDQDTDAGVRNALGAAAKHIEQQLKWGEWLGNVLSGLSLGSILLLAALGLAITYGLLGVINMAHGEMLMLGAYSTYVVQGVFRRFMPAHVDYYILLALPVAFGVTALIGIGLERLIIRRLYGRPLETLLATWGISLMLIQLVRLIFGAQNVQVENPGWLSGGVAVLPNLTLTWNRIAIFLFTLLVLALTWLLLNKTRLGLYVRAVTQNRAMADCVGVRTGRVDSLAFGLGSGIAGLAGVALSQVGNVGPDLGQAYIVDSFMVVVLGGVGQLAGAVLGGLGLGVLSKLIEPSMGAVLAKIIILVAIVLFIQKRPQGIFALKGRMAEG